MSEVSSPSADGPRVGAAVSTSVRTEAVQRVVKVRRDYNEWVARETMEDYALRFTPHSFRKWSELRVANTAFGAASFLVLEAVGATLLVEYGFVNAFWAIIATGLIIFLAGLPISRYAARHGVDMDLLTRGAGFGYIGSTLTSLIYASFTFIFFALEAAVMAYALELAFDIPPAWGYLICALVVVPLVTHGVTVISRLQVWTQPLWILMLVVPYVFVFQKNPGVLKELVGYAGSAGQGGRFDFAMFGAAMTVGIALITQMGEQVDYLRFMPALTKKNRARWWAGVLIGGPGWVVPGVIKMLGGALLAFLAISHAVPVDRAVDPNQMYLAAYEYVFPRTTWAIAATALLVVVSQLKINVTNAYAGSLAWSNFFARLTHSHPGRVVWVIFNTIIALMLMELNVFSALGRVLGLYSNIAISWMMAVVADLVINKPMGWSPKGIEFKRAHLYDINPVGVGAMGLASAVSIVAYLGWLGPMAQAFSALIALATAFVASPVIAWWTKGKYYLAREPGEHAHFDTSVRTGWFGRLLQDEATPRAVGLGTFPGHVEPTSVQAEPASIQVEPASIQVEPSSVQAEPSFVHAEPSSVHAEPTPVQAEPTPVQAEPISVQAEVSKPHPASRQCTICEREYEPDDMAYCPAYLGHICSLCCSLDARCNDMCKPQASWSAQWQAAVRKLLPSVMWHKLDTELGRYLLAMSAIVPMLGMLFYMIYQHELRQITDLPDGAREALAQGIGLGFIKVYAALVVVTAIVTWWIVLTHKSRQVAQEESNRQTQALNEQARALRHEIESHQRTDEALQQAKRNADLANQAKSRYISSISHELRTPLNSIIGYAQLLDEDEGVPAHRKQAVSVIRRGGDHLLSLIEGTLDIARIEGGKLTLDVKPMRFQECVQQLVRMFELQAAGKGLSFRHEVNGSIPDVVRADEKRMRQVLINVLGNAVKFTSKGEVVFRMSHAREMAVFEIEDTGPGIAPHEIAQVFEPFARGSAVSSAAGGGTGLGLTISKMLTDLMGGEMMVQSKVATDADASSGTLFRIRLFLPEVRAAVAERELPRVARIGYEGERRMVLVVDNEEVDRDLLVNMLAPLGFDVRRAASGHECLAMLREIQPHAILMDLAMPGIDGWQTIRRMRREGLSSAPVAIVSANAFDRGLDNDVGIVPGDFVLKPVRKSELLDWLGRALALRWLNAPLPAPPVATSPAWLAQLVLPGEHRLKALEEHIQLGYVRGIVRQLDEIAAESAQCAAFVAHMRDLARQFQLDAMSSVLRKARDARIAD